MKKRKKYCKYCGEAFYPKRIDALYCSTSCRSMAYRAKKRPMVYKNLVTVQFDLEFKEHLLLHDAGQKLEMAPNEYASLVVKRSLLKTKIIEP